MTTSPALLMTTTLPTNVIGNGRIIKNITFPVSHNNSFSKKKWHTPDLDPSSQILWLNIHNPTWTRPGVLPSFESKFRRMNFVLSSSFTAQQTCVRFVLHSTHDDGKRKSQHSSSFGQRRLPTGGIQGPFLHHYKLYSSVLRPPTGHVGSKGMG